MNWTDMRTLGRGGVVAKGFTHLTQNTVPSEAPWPPEDLLVLFHPSNLSRTCSATTIKLYFAYESFCIVVVALSALRQYCSNFTTAKGSAFSQALTDTTHLITRKLKENMQRGIAFPPLSSLK